MVWAPTTDTRPVVGDQDNSKRLQRDYDALFARHKVRARRGGEGSGGCPGSAHLAAPGACPQCQRQLGDALPQLQACGAAHL